MAKPDDEDPRVTDLRSYKKAREQAAKRKPPNPRAQMRESLLGANPRAGLILGIAAVVLIIFVFGPAIAQLLSRLL